MNAVDPWALTLDAGGAVLIAAALQVITTIVGTIVVACFGVSYRRQQSLARAERRSRIHAEAIQAVHDYLEAPYRVRRRDGSPEARMALAEAVSDIQSRLRYYDALLRLESTASVADAFADAVAAARREAGAAITEAWKSPPTKRDEDVPIGEKIETPESNRLITIALAAMKAAG